MNALMKFIVFCLVLIVQPILVNGAYYNDAANDRS
jgi:hypothetical protein